MWFSVGKDAWVRAFALAARRGAGGQSRKQDMSDALKAQVLATTTASASRTRHSRAESISGKTARPRSASPNPLPQSPRLRLSMSQVLVRLKKCPRQESNLRPLVPELCIAPHRDGATSESGVSAGFSAHLGRTESPCSRANVATALSPFTQHARLVLSFQPPVHGFGFPSQVPPHLHRRRPIRHRAGTPVVDRLHRDVQPRGDVVDVEESTWRVCRWLRRGDVGKGAPVDPHSWSPVVGHQSCGRICSQVVS